MKTTDTIKLYVISMMECVFLLTNGNGVQVENSHCWL